MNDLTPDELDFLATWLMHHGSDPADIFHATWYQLHNHSVYDIEIRKYLSYALGRYRLNERGLATIEQGVKQN